MQSKISPPATLGLLGLGLMGTAMTQRFLGAGFRVVGYDVSAKARERFVALGGGMSDSVSNVFRDCECVVLSLPDSAIALEVLSGVDGQRHSCSLVIDTTTGSPSDVDALAAAAGAIGAEYVDATISGSSAQVETGNVAIMAGASAQSFVRCEAVLSAIGRDVMHTGGVGSGARMKLVTNLILGLNRAALAEGLHLAHMLGISSDTLAEVLPRTMAHSAIMDTKLTKMLNENFAAQARLSQHLKDVRLMLEQANACGSALPLSEAHAGLLESAERLGYGDADNSAVMKAYTPPEPCN
ncbi:MAG: NAD(P)-dependent oxidoreductase [Verrucomicrobiales bacterium]